MEVAVVVVVVVVQMPRLKTRCFTAPQHVARGHLTDVN